jgi:hypothetical protein
MVILSFCMMFVSDLMTPAWSTLFNAGPVFCPASDGASWRPFLKWLRLPANATSGEAVTGAMPSSFISCLLAGGIGHGLLLELLFVCIYALVQRGNVSEEIAHHALHSGGKRFAGGAALRARR